MKLAAMILLGWWAAHYAYQWAHVEHQGTVFNIMRSAVSLMLLTMIAYQSRVVALPAAGMAGEEIQVIGCGTWWLVSPWEIKPGDELCSSGLGIPLGSIGIMALGMVAAHLYDEGKKNDRR